jgi:hypothetical protein
VDFCMRVILVPSSFLSELLDNSSELSDKFWIFLE